MTLVTNGPGAWSLMIRFIPSTIRSAGFLRRWRPLNGCTRRRLGFGNYLPISWAANTCIGIFAFLLSGSGWSAFDRRRWFLALKAKKKKLEWKPTIVINSQHTSSGRNWWRVRSNIISGIPRGKVRVIGIRILNSSKSQTQVMIEWWRDYLLNRRETISIFILFFCSMYGRKIKALCTCRPIMKAN